MLVCPSAAVVHVSAGGDGAGAGGLVPSRVRGGLALAGRARPVAARPAALRRRRHHHHPHTDQPAQA